MTALADDNLEAVSEGVPYRTAQELPGVLSNKGEFATKCAGASYCRELLQDSSFKLVKTIKFWRSTMTWYSSPEREVNCR